MQKQTFLQVSTGILVNTTNTPQNAIIVTSFSDSSSGNPIIHGNATSPSILTRTAAYLYPTDNITIYSYYVNDGGHTDANFTKTTSYKRYNINYGSLHQFYSFNWNLSSINNYSNFVFNIYGGTFAPKEHLHPTGMVFARTYARTYVCTYVTLENIVHSISRGRIDTKC